MLVRFLLFFWLMICCTSCNFFSNNKKSLQKENTLTFNAVDVSPSFSVCDSLIDKAEKTTCFRKTIHQKLTENLSKHVFTTKDSVDELINVTLLINSNGKITVTSVESSAKIAQEIPQLDSILSTCVNHLPKIYPAIKRGIPVNTEYKLPIRIWLKN